MKRGIQTRVYIIRTWLFAVMMMISRFHAAAQPPGAPDPSAALLMTQPQINTSAPVTATATFDPPIVRPGDTSTYRVTFNAMLDSIRWPEDVIAPAQLEMSPGGRGQMFLPAGPTLLPRSTINTRARATAEGTFTVPRYIVYVYGKPVTVPEAQLQVVGDPNIPVPKGRDVQVELESTNVFVGQPLGVKVVMLGETSGIVEALTLIKLQGEGFITDQTAARQRVQPIAPGSNSLPAFIYETQITPIVPGQMTLTAQGFTAGNQFTGPITITGHVTIPGGPPQYLLVDTPPVTLNVRPVPQTGRLPGYSGAIGTFRVDSPTLSTNVLKVGDPVTYSVRIQGEGNLPRLVPPRPTDVAAWKIYAGESDPSPPQLVQARGFIVFNYTFVPTTDDTDATPAIPFCYFDPKTETFVNLDLPSLPVAVEPSPIPINFSDVAQASGSAAKEEEALQLTTLATTPGKTMSSLSPSQSGIWFPLVQVVPALCFAALWWWDRRRRFIETHPDVVRRRRARRALRREWAELRKAAGLGDTSRFAAAAVSAMRVACAPHYPAEPRAIVSTDVLPLLADSDTSMHDTVRAVFAAANAERFAIESVGKRNLLALRTNVDRVLARLEAML